MNVVLEELGIGPEEINEDIVGVVGMELSESNIIVVPATEYIAQMAVSFVGVDELLFSFSVSLICTWVIFNCKPAVGSLNIGKACSSRDPQNFIIGRLSARVVFLEETFLMLFFHSVLVEEPLEEFVGIVNGKILALDFVVVMTLTNIREGSVGFVDVVEATLSVHSIVGVLLRVPLSS